jgi:tetratricopeptide (TPR) repeat protein
MIDYNGKRNIFSRPKKTSKPALIFLLLVLIMAGLFVVRGFSSGQIQPILQVTLTPTRTFNSFANEGQVHFLAGNLEKAIEAYMKAIEINPEDTNLRAELARIQVYSTSQITVDAEKRARLDEAIANIDEGLAINPLSSNLHAVKAFAYDWYGSSGVAGESSQEYLIKGEQSAVEALQYDNTNALALAYYAELLIDQQKWPQAQQYIAQALERDSSLMDVHRVNGNIQEAIANYTQAIEEYQEAIEITPNLNFLYMSLGANYRKLANMAVTTPEQNYYYELALEAFAKAATINEQLGVSDPIPLISIGNTYVQMGEFFAAARNVLKALEFSPDDPTVYGQLGVVYYKARNYEGSILPLRCSVYGCTATESCVVRNGGAECDPEEVTDYPINGLELTNNTAIYYYIYGSVLAGLHQPNNGYCEEAMVVFDELTDVFAADETIMGIVNEGVAICNYYGYR